MPALNQPDNKYEKENTIILPDVKEQKSVVEKRENFKRADSGVGKLYFDGMYLDLRNNFYLRNYDF